MIQIREYLTTKISKSKIKATDDTIKQIVKEEMDMYGHDCNLNHIDVSNITDMNSLFSCDQHDLGESYSDLNPDISGWDVSNVENMRCMFWECKNFNSNISEWNVSNVTTMAFMFCKCESFNQDLNMWDVNHVIDMQEMFVECISFNQPLYKWDVSNVTDMKYMFYGCKSFNKNLSKWNMSSVESHRRMFDDCPIEEKINRILSYDTDKRIFDNKDKQVKDKSYR